MENVSSQTNAIFRNLAILSVTIFIYGMILSMIRIRFGIPNQRVPTPYKIWIASGFFVISFCYVVKIIFPTQSPSFIWLNILLGFGIANTLILEIHILTRMVKYGKRHKHQREAKILKALGYLYLSRYGVATIVFTILGIVFWWNIPEVIQPFVAFGILVYFNLIPMIWLKYFFRPHAESLLKYVEDKTDLKPVFEKYHISKREQEILKLILDGKSNKEIEEILFISYHTVKNHVYNLYQKLGIKTRYEVVHFFTKYQKEKT